MRIAEDSPWSRTEVDDHLDGFIAPLRLSATDGRGYPRVCSLWFRRDGDRLLCATQADAWIAKALARDPRCGFELAPNEPPYFGVRGIGRATVGREGGPEELERLIDRYLGDRSSSIAKWLLSRADHEVLIAIEVERLSAWDYRDRMTR